MKHSLFPLLLSSLFLLSCGVSPRVVQNEPGPVVSSNAVSPDFSSPHPGEYAVLWHQKSGEYKALCIQAFRMAESRLTEIREQKDGETFHDPVVVVDVDETILDNSPYFARLVLNNEVFTDESWKEWTGMKAAKFLPGAESFLQHAENLGFPVYFVSNRDEVEIKSTIQNLKNLGYKNLNPELFLFKGAERNKTKRREKIAAEHDIVLLIGDNLLDFTEAFAQFEAEELVDQKELMKEIGKRFIVLPNALYGEWLYDKSGSGLAGDELNEDGIRFRKSQIRSY